MLNALIKFSIENKLVIGFFTVALVLWGGWSATRLPIDAVPDITNNQVQVITTSPSLAAEDIERLVTFPLEVGLSNIPGITELRSFSRFGLSIVTIVFTDETDVYWARQQISERLQAVGAQIPPGVGTPVMAPVTTGLGEIFQYTVTPKKGYEARYTLADLRSIQDWIIRRGLLGTPGVADVSGFGGQVKQYEIAIDPDRLRSVGITIAELFRALQQNNQNTGGAYIDKQPNAYFIRSEGLIGSPDDIASIVVKLGNQGAGQVGSPVRVRDIATVQIGSAVRYGAVTRNGEGETVGALVMMIKGGNSSAVIKQVKARIAEIQKTLPEGVEIIPFLDRTKMVNNAIGTVERNLMEGALIVIFVLVLLLGDFRAGLVVASVIPLALLFAIGMMHLFGISGNLMSLGAIDFGLIVDGAVIIVEATLHHLHRRRHERVAERPHNDDADTAVLSQTEMDEEVFGAASRIRSSAAFGELIILIVYLPILSLSGIEGKMFRPMAFTVAFAILGAFMLSLTYVPMVSALFLSKKVAQKTSFSDKLMRWLFRVYEPLLLRSLRHRRLILVASLLLMASAVFAFTRMGGEFIPQLDEGDFAIDTRTLPGSSISETIEATLKGERVLLNQFPEVEQVVAKIGSGEIPTDPMPIEAADMMVILKPRSEWTSAATRDELAEKMSQALSVIPGVTFGIQQPVQMRFNELMTGSRQDVALKIYGEDLNELTRLAQQVGGLVRKIEGTADLYVEQVEGLAQILIRLDRNAIAKYGLNVSDVNQSINTAFAGQVAGSVYEGEKRYDLVLRLAENKRQSIEDIRSLYIATPGGEGGQPNQIPLGQLATVSLVQAPNQIQRDQTHRRITLGFNVRSNSRSGSESSRDVESIVTELQQKVSAQIKFPPGYSVSYGGTFQNLIDARQRLGIAVPLALALIFALLYFTFKSVRQSLLIFVAIPLAAVGGVFALQLREMPFSISAGVGFIALFGVAVLNGIVLIAEFNRLRFDENLTDMTEIIRKGTEIRLRPVILTALVASFGFIPMALSNSAGAEVQKPLATVVIGGLLTATLLTLIVLPVLYSLVEKKSLDRQARQAPKRNVPVVPILLLLLLESFASRGQGAANQFLTLEQAVQQADTRNAQLQVGGLAIVQQQALRRTAFDAGRLTASVLLGQYNSSRFDNNLTLTHTIPNPTLTRRLADLNDRTVAVREASLALSRHEVQYQTKAAFYELNYLLQRRKLFRQQDTLLREFVRAATLRFKTGETGNLEKATAESQQAEQQVRLAQLEATLLASRTNLKTILYSPADLAVSEQALPKLTLPALADSLLLLPPVQHPQVRRQEAQTRVAEQGRVVEQTRLRPDFLVGVATQTLIGPQSVNGKELFFGGGHRFTVAQLGVTFPLLGKAQKARINAARAGEQVAQAELQAVVFSVSQQRQQALAQFSQYQQALAYYEQSGLAQAALIQTSALKAFRGGDIGYVEFSLAIQQALAIRATYLDLLNQYNQSVLYILFMLGNS